MLPADAWDSSQAELVHWEVSNRFLSFRSSLCTQLIVTSLLFACLPWGALEKWEKDQKKRKKKRGGGAPTARCVVLLGVATRGWRGDEVETSHGRLASISAAFLQSHDRVNFRFWQQLNGQDGGALAAHSSTWPIGRLAGRTREVIFTHTHKKHPTQNNKTNNKLTPHHRQLSC